MSLRIYVLNNIVVIFDWITISFCSKYLKLLISVLYLFLSGLWSMVMELLPLDKYIYTLISCNALTKIRNGKIVIRVCNVLVCHT